MRRDAARVRLRVAIGVVPHQRVSKHRSDPIPSLAMENVVIPIRNLRLRNHAGRVKSLSAQVFIRDFKPLCNIFIIPFCYF